MASITETGDLWASADPRDVAAKLHQRLQVASYDDTYAYLKNLDNGRETRIRLVRLAMANQYRKIT